MSEYGLAFHHFGLAVRQPEKAVRFLKGLGYEPGESIRDGLQNVDLMLCTSRSMPAVEVISPTEMPGPLTSVLKSRFEMIYHLCYEAADVEATLQALKDDRVRTICISPPKPAILFDGRRVSFYQVSGFGMIEILEKEGPATARIG